MNHHARQTRDRGGYFVLSAYMALTFNIAAGMRFLPPSAHHHT
jgi:hypothetical protein